ncbi:MAG: response regulator transcription factor [Bacteroidales bacterium]
MAKVQILISDKSSLILCGLLSLIDKLPVACDVRSTNSPHKLIDLLKNNSPDILIVNPSILEKNQLKSFKDAIQQNDIRFILLQSDNKEGYNNLHYDELITGCDNEEQIVAKISSLLGTIENRSIKKRNESISAREENIVREIALGLSNKEIADKLFISQHTVITHRKNITRKLGIKSVSGLTIYAILNKLISLDEVK